MSKIDALTHTACARAVIDVAEDAIRDPGVDDAGASALARVALRACREHGEAATAALPPPVPARRAT